MAKTIEKQRAGNRQQPASGRSSVIGSFLRNPVRSFIAAFDSYFLHQSKLFYKLFMLIGFFVIFGVVMVLSASNVQSIIDNGDPFADFKSQAGLAVVGFILMIFISRIRVENFERLGNLFFLGTVFLQLLVLVPGIGRTVGGNTNWISLFGIVIQPSEFLKLGLVFGLANVAMRYRDSWNQALIGPLVMILVGGGTALVIYATGNDLGTALVIGAVIMVLSFLSGMKLRYWFGIILVAGLLLLPTFMTNGNRLARIFSFVGQGAGGDSGLGWQVEHGIWALASGGFWGTGLGQAKLNWGWIPEVENDFIFAVIGEEGGLLGAMVVVIAFFLLARYINKVGSGSRNEFTSIASTTIMLLILIQALINIAVVLNLFPVIGVPLPLISKGGSSLLATLLALGVVLAIERDKSMPEFGRSRR